jgi:hypothetical protein
MLEMVRNKFQNRNFIQPMGRFDMHLRRLNCFHLGFVRKGDIFFLKFFSLMCSHYVPSSLQNVPQVPQDVPINKSILSLVVLGTIQFSTILANINKFFFLFFTKPFCKLFSQVESSILNKFGKY